jgi:predicted component of type VI protein secretion system
MIDVVAGAFYVTDLASTNGTYVDGEELTAGTPCKLVQGAEVIFGARTWRRRARRDTGRPVGASGGPRPPQPLREGARSDAAGVRCARGERRATQQRSMHALAQRASAYTHGSRRAASWRSAQIRNCVPSARAAAPHACCPAAPGDEFLCKFVFEEISDAELAA